MKKFKADLLAVEPEGIQTKLGKHSVFRFQTATPAHTFESVIKVVDGSWLIELTARDSYDESLARFMLDQLEGQQLPTHGSSKIRVVPVKFPRRWKFECLVIVPPRVTGRFAHESKRLRMVTYWVVPAFHGEFNDLDNGKAFEHQIYRRDGWKVTVVRWDRSRKTKPVWD